MDHHRMMGETIRMGWNLLRPLSGGVRVSRKVRRSINRGDAARNAALWPEAARHYRRALTDMPGLPHIHVQLGHVLKEAGLTGEAMEAYRAAARGNPDDIEPHIWLAALARSAGKPDEAIDHEIAILRLRPDRFQTLVTVLRNLSHTREQDRGFIAELGLTNPIPQTDAPPLLSKPTPLYVDVGDLLAYFGRARLPTGIQRVQIEILQALFESASVAAIAYAPAISGWKELPRADFEALATLSVASGDSHDPVWRTAVLRVLQTLMAAPALSFPQQSTIVNLGTALSDRNYFLAVRNAKSQRSVHYVALIYDVIPLVAPTLVPGDLVQDCEFWLDTLARTADGFIAISEASRSDLLRVAAERGAPIAKSATRVLPLDGDGRLACLDPLSDTALDRWALSPNGYVLYTSTIEPRKNQIGALKAWSLLLRKLGKARVPRLVLVGRMGWRSEPVAQWLRDHHDLRECVLNLSGISDRDLDLLYRNCLFTLYPSLYEGWGLPVSESLGYGKVPVISRTSSLPEAGLDFAVYFDPAAPSEIAAAVESLLLDPVRLAAMQTRIVSSYRWRSWAEIARQLFDDARAIAEAADESGGPAQRIVVTGARYSLALDRASDEKVGEHFRHGDGWATPTITGSRLAGGDTQLLFAHPAEGTLRLTCHARNATVECDVDLRNRSTQIFDWLHVTVSSRAGIVRVALKCREPSITIRHFKIMPAA